MRIFSTQILSNSLWMMLEKVIGIFGLIFVNALMAKYIGPENFGKLAFTTSIFLFVQTLAWFGAQNILFKRFSQNAKSGLKLALATQLTRQMYCVLASIAALTYLWFYSDPLTFIFGIGNFIASYFIVSDFYIVYNNSQLISYVNAISNILGLAVALLLRFLLVFFEAEPYTMVYPIIVIAILPFVVRKLYYHKKCEHQPLVLNSWKYNKYIFFTGGSLVLSSLSIVFYTQIANIFLAKYENYSDLAIYNVSLSLGGSWGFVNMALITSYFSKIYEEKNIFVQNNYIKQLHRLVILISFLAFIFLILFGSWIVDFLYGEDYRKSAHLLPYVVIGAALSTLGSISYRFMLKFNAYRYLSIKMFVVALLSLPISYFFIKIHGLKGAMFFYIIIEFISLTIANYFFKDSIVLKMHLNVFKIK